MSQQVQELIDKIKSEGIAEAEKKSKDIQTKAESSSQKVIADAKSEADQIISRANDEAKKIHESTEMALKQAARDMILSLRGQIESVLQGVVKKEVKDSLNAESLAQIIETVIKGSLDDKNKDETIEVLLNAKDLSKLQDGFTAKLQKAVKQPLKFDSAEGIDKGFLISFDSGKSSFDFTDESLANYLGKFLNAQVASLVQESVSS